MYTHLKLSWRWFGVFGTLIVIVDKNVVLGGSRRRVAVKIVIIYFI